MLTMNKNHTFVIAEAGSNWKCGSYEDDLFQAKQLIDIASSSGADAVKFQTFRSESVYVENAGNIGYLKNYTNSDINTIFKNLEMPYEMIPELYKYWQQKKIIFMSTPFSIDDAKIIDKYTPIHKLASYEINHVRLLEFLSKTKKPILISTGASNVAEIDFAVQLIKQNGNNSIGVMQCTAKYPAPIESLNISVISFFKKKYGCSVGLSDHSVDPVMAPILAVAMGATIIEKHFTVDRNLNGPDHKFALIPNELKQMINAIRLAEKAKGNGIKNVLDVEIELQNFAKRSIQAISDIVENDLLIENVNIGVLRPGNKKRGSESRFLNEIIGKKARNSIKQGDGVTLQDCK